MRCRLQHRIELVREAVARHESRGEADHVEGAREVLEELEEELDEVLLDLGYPREHEHRNYGSRRRDDAT